MNLSLHLLKKINKIALIPTETCKKCLNNYDKTCINLQVTFKTFENVNYNQSKFLIIHINL